MNYLLQVKERILFALISLLFAMGSSFAQDLACIPVFGTNTTNVLSSVTINGVTNNTTSIASYENFPSLNLGTVNAGNNIVINASGTLASYNNISIVAFMDFNNDGLIDNNSERIEIYSRSSYNPANYTSGNVNFTIPAYVPSGTHKIRIVAFCSTSGVNSCNSVPGGVKGQAEDYYITVIGQACTAPTATYSIVPNCTNNTFNVSVSVTSLGNATSVQIKNGNTVLQTVSSTGTYSVGPFQSGSSVSLNVANAANNTCASTAQSLSHTCPCTEPTATYTVVPDCDNNQYSISANVSNFGTASTVGILVNGNTFQTISSTGTYNIGPFQSGTTQNINVANASNNSCAAVTQTLSYTCPSCVAPTANYEVIDNCANQTYSVNVLVSNLGSASNVTISNNGTISQTVSSTGTYTFGPFANGTSSQFVVANASNANCSTSSSTLTSGCAPCTTASALYTVVEDCLNNQFSIQVALANLGTASSIEILNGTTVLTTATSTGNYTVGPFTNGDQIILTLTDAANEFCTTSSQTLTSACPACVEPTATVEVIDNCAEQTFTIAVNVTDLGSATTLAFNNGTTLIQSISATGNYVFGPYANGTIVELNAINEQNVTCTIDFNTQASACTPCQTPEVTFTVVPACEEEGFYIEAVVTSMGSNTTLTNGSTVIEETGTYSFGPFNSGEEASILLQGNTSNACVIESEVLTFTCPTCEAPEATFATVENCDNDQFYVTIDLTSMGNSTSITVENLTIIETGTYTVGPFASQETVYVTLHGNITTDCSLVSEALTFDCSTFEEPGTAVETTDFAFAVYPNPTNGAFTIEAEVNGKVNVLDATGKVVDQFEIEIGKNNISTTNLASGIYTLQIQTKQGNQFQRLSIQH